MLQRYAFFPTLQNKKRKKKVFPISCYLNMHFFDLSNDIFSTTMHTFVPTTTQETNLTN